MQQIPRSGRSRGRRMMGKFGMKTEWTKQDLQEFMQGAQVAFDSVTLTELDAEARRNWQDDGLMVDYELRNGQVNCVLRRQVKIEGQLQEVQMVAPLAGNALPEDRMTERERELCRDDMNHDYLSGVYNRRYFETEFCTRLDEWTNDHRIASLALVSLDGAAQLQAQQGQAVMNQVICFVGNQWRKHFDRPDERVVCRLTGSLFAIGCADITAEEFAAELADLYTKMPKECVASIGMMHVVPFTQSIACACTNEVRGKDWGALYGLCRDRLRKKQSEGGNGVA